MRKLWTSAATGILAAGVLAIALIAHAAAAPAGERAVVRAFAYHDVSPAGAVAVVAWNDSAESLSVKAAIEEALQGEGWTVEAGAPRELRFEIAVRRLGPEPATPSLGRITGGSGGIGARVNVWSSTRDSLLGGRRGDGDRQETVIQLTTTLRERGGERRTLWRGEGQMRLGDLGRAEAAGRLARPLVARLGRKQSGTTVTLQP